MRFGKPTRRGSLSICCVTDQSPEQTRAVLAGVRAVADEVVIGVDPSRAAELRAFQRLADRTFITESGPLERNIAAIHDACSHPWVFRLDTDEIASPALVRRLPELIAHPTARQFAFTRRWLTPDAGRWIDERPWWPDWQVRLVRRETAVFLPEVHVPVELDAPRLFSTDPIYHATVALLSPAQRRRKMLEYEIVHRNGPGTLREPTAIIYEPERHSSREPVPVPDEDLDAIRAFFAVVSPSVARTIPRPADPAPKRTSAAAASDIVPPQPSEGLALDAEADVALLEPEPQFTSGEITTVLARVTNRSTQRWASGNEVGDPGHVVSYRWMRPGSAAEEGVRTLLPGPVDPGSSAVVPVQIVGTPTAGPATLSIEVVDEHVRWLPGGAKLSTSLSEPRALPRHREIRDARSAPIPRIVHRIWLGDAPMPPEYEAYGRSWAEHHPGWEHRLWTDQDVPHPPGADNARNLSERSDLLRYEILRAHGGVYVDTDVECLRPIDDLLTGVTAFAAYEVPGRLCGAVVGSVPGHGAFEELVELAAITTGRGHFPESVTTFITYVLEAWPDVTLFDASRFYPELWDGTPNVGADRPYARHYWGQSWLVHDSAPSPSSPASGGGSSPITAVFDAHKR